MSAIGPIGSRRLAGRWGARVILTVAILAQLFACQAVLASTADVPAVAIQDVGHGTGHDIVCEAVQAVASTSTARAAASDCPAGPGHSATLLALVAATLILGVRAGPGDVLSWAPRRLVDGRHRLLAVGITRV